MNRVFSIIIPTYNCSELLRQTLESIFMQDKSLFECIIVDGSSKDTTVNTIFEYKNKYPDNIKYISEPDRGIYDAMNKGINLAQGEYLYFIGAGDILISNSLTDVYKYTSDNLDLIYGNVFMKSKNFCQGYEVNQKDISITFMCHQQIFYRKSVFDELGKYNLNYKVYADAEFNIKCFGQYKYNKKYINVDIAKYKGNGFSDNIIDEKFIIDYKNIICKYLGSDIYYLYYKKSGRQLIDYLYNTSVKFDIYSNKKYINNIIKIFDEKNSIDRIQNIYLNYQNINSEDRKNIKVIYEYDENIDDENFVIVTDFVKSAELIDFLKDKIKENIIVFGASNLSRKLIKYINKFLKYKNILYILDNDNKKTGKEFNGYKIFLPSDVLCLEKFKILVASTWFKDIRDQLLEIGCKRKNIIRVSS